MPERQAYGDLDGLAGCSFVTTTTATSPMLYSFLSLIFLTLVTARNVTVDDTDPSIVYLLDPSSQTSRWTPVDANKGVGETCFPASNCQSAGLDVKQVHGGTWIEGSDTVTMLYNFTGYAIDVYFVFRNELGDGTQVTFMIDGHIEEIFAKNGTDVGWLYNYRAFSASGLPDTQHQLQLVGGSPNLFVFDYLVYQTNQAATTTIQASVVVGTPGVVPTTSSVPTTVGTGTTTTPAPSLSSTPSQSVGSNGASHLESGCLGILLSFCVMLLASEF